MSHPTTVNTSKDTTHDHTPTIQRPDVRAGSEDDRLTEQQRAEVVRVARSFVGTKYHHMGRVKGAGVDCATLLAEVYYEAGVLREPLAIEYYPMDWHLHRDDERYLRMVQRYCREIREEQAQPGDVVMYHFGRAWAHGGIVVSTPATAKPALAGDPAVQAHRPFDSPAGAGSLRAGCGAETRSDLAIVSPGDCAIENGQMTQSPDGQMLIVHAVVNQAVQLADGERDGMLIGRKRRYFSPW